MECKNKHFRYILLLYSRKGENAAQAAKKLRDAYREEALRGLGSQKIDFFIAFFNSITIQKVNAKVLNRLDEKSKNERHKG